MSVSSGRSTLCASANEELGILADSNPLTNSIRSAFQYPILRFRKVTGTIPPVLTAARGTQDVTVPTAAPTHQDFPYRFLHGDFAFEGNMEEAPCLVKAEGEVTAMAVRLRRLLGRQLLQRSRMRSQLFMYF